MTETSTLQTPEQQGQEIEKPVVPEIAPPKDLFDKDEMTYFGSEDRHAGGVIGKMLSLFFFYTVIVMLLVAIWTFLVTAQ